MPERKLRVFSYIPKKTSQRARPVSPVDRRGMDVWLDVENYAENVKKEILLVLIIADEKPEGTIFVVPLRLDDCQARRRIRAWWYVDYFSITTTNEMFVEFLNDVVI